MIGWEKGRGDKEQKGRTRNQANVSGYRMFMTLRRLSIDSPLRASDGGKGSVPPTRSAIVQTHLVKSYARTAQRRAHCTCLRLASCSGPDVNARRYTCPRAQGGQRRQGSGG